MSSGIVRSDRKRAHAPMRNLHDSSRIDLLKQATFIKYRVRPEKRDVVWLKEIAPVANRKCYDTGKKLTAAAPSPISK